MSALELSPFRYAVMLQVGLAFIAGFLEACGLIALFGVFIGHITANIVVLGAAIATGLPGSAIKLLALVVFVAVVAATHLSIHLLRLRGVDAARFIMAVELGLLLAFVTAGAWFVPFTDPAGWSTMLTAALGVATLAVQNSGMRLMWKAHPSTTVMTLNLTQLALDGVVILREPRDASAAARDRLALVAPTLGGFLVGAAGGCLGYLVAGFYSGFAPAAVLLALIVVREQPSSASA